MTSISELLAPTPRYNDLDEGLGIDVLTDTYSNGGVGDANTFALDAGLGGDGGTNTLTIDPNVAVGAGAAATRFPDGLWAPSTEIELGAPSLPGLFVLTAQVDDFHGGLGNDLFIGTYSDGGVGDGNTFQTGDILRGCLETR